MSFCAEAFYNLGILFKDQGSHSQALANFADVIRIDPKLYFVYSAIAGILYAQGELDEAIKNCDKALDIESNYVQAWIVKARSLYALGEGNEALTCALRAVELSPDSHNSYAVLASILCGQGKIKESIENYKVALAILANLPKGREVSSSVSAKDLEKSAEALDELSNLLSSNGIEFFLSGTSLGLCTKGVSFNLSSAVCELGIVGFGQQEKLFDVVNQSEGFGFTNALNLKIDDAPLKLSIQHIASGALIDVYFYHSRGGRFYTGVSHLQGSVLLEFSPFELEVADYIGKQFNIPSNHKKYLSEVFGDLSDSGKFFDTIIAAQNICFGDEFALCLSYGKAV